MPELKERLLSFPPEKLAGIIAKYYSKDDGIRRDVDILLSSVQGGEIILTELREMIDQMKYYPASAFKDKLAAYMRAEKDKRKRIEAYYLFIESALTEYEQKQCDHRMIMVASACYGKAVKMMDDELWKDFFDRTFAIAKRFDEIPLSSAVQAIWYYQEKKMEYD